MASMGSTGSRINRQVLHGGKRLFDGPGKPKAGDVVGSVNLIRDGPNQWRLEWFEEDAQFHPGLVVVSLFHRSIKINQTNHSLMTRSDAQRKLGFDPMVQRHCEP